MKISLKVFGERIWGDESTKFYIQEIKRAFQEKYPSIELTRNTFKRLSRNCRNKLIENFFINAAILEMQRQRELSKKWCRMLCK